MPNKRRIGPNTILVEAETALPRMSKSARIAQLNLDTERIPEQPRTIMPGKVDNIILSPHPSQSERVHISIEGADHGFCDIRIENSLTDEHGDEVKLKKGAYVEVTIAARPGGAKR
jgi:hypothetical protein